MFEKFHSIFSKNPNQNAKYFTLKTLFILQWDNTWQYKYFRFSKVFQGHFDKESEILFTTTYTETGFPHQNNLEKPDNV